MHEMNWHELDSAELAVDAPNELIHDSTEILVLFHVLSGWHRDLHQDDFADPFWVFCEEDFESVELLWNAFNIIKTIHANNKLDALELLLKGCYSFLDLWLLKAFVKLFRVDSDWKGANSDNLGLVVDTVRCGWKASV